MLIFFLLLSLYSHVNCAWDMDMIVLLTNFEQLNVFNNSAFFCQICFPHDNFSVWALILSYPATDLYGDDQIHTNVVCL